MHEPEALFINGTRARQVHVSGPCTAYSRWFRCVKGMRYGAKSFAAETKTRNTMTFRLHPLIVLALSSTLAHAQGDWTQALQSSAPTLEGGTVTRICPDGGIVSLGYYRDQAVFGQHTLPGGFPSQNVVFVVKHDEAGDVEWARSITNTDPSDWVVGHGMDVDSDGNIIVGGTTIDTLLVDGAYATHVANAQGTEAMFIIKFSPTGTVLWAVDAESTAFGSELMSLVVDPSDNIWFCGPISSAASKAFKLNGATGIEMVETGVIPGQVRQIDTDAAGNVYLRGQSLGSFTLNGVTCPANSLLGGNTTNWTGKLNTNGIAQWFHVPDQGHLGFSPWQHANQAATTDGRCYVEAYSDMRVNGDTISTGANQRGLYMLDANGSPAWWTVLNRSGILNVEDMTADPAGNCWITGTSVGILDLLDTVVEHTGLFAFHIGAEGSVLQRVFGPTVLHSYSVDAVAGLAVFGGEYSSTISFGTHQITDNLRGLFVARYEHPLNVGVPEGIAPFAFSAFPNPAQDRIRLAGLPTGTVTVELHNAQGQLLQRTERFNAEQDVIDLSQLPVGPLFVRVHSALSEACVRIIHLH